MKSVNDKQRIFGSFRPSFRKMRIQEKVFISVSSGILLLMLMCTYALDIADTGKQVKENMFCWIMTQPKNHRIKVKTYRMLIGLLCDDIIISYKLYFCNNSTL